jgi:hypothetical protein
MEINKVFKKVFSVNEKLLANGLTFIEIETFWNDCFKKAKCKKQLKLNL